MESWKTCFRFRIFWVVQIRQCTHAHLNIEWNVTTKCLIFPWNYDFIFFLEKASRVKLAKRSGFVKKFTLTDCSFFTQLLLFDFSLFINLNKFYSSFLKNWNFHFHILGGWSWVAVMVIIVKSNYTSNLSYRFTLWQLLKRKNPDKTFFQQNNFNF